MIWERNGARLQEGVPPLPDAGALSIAREGLGEVSPGRERTSAMTIDRSFVELNRKATERMRALAARLSDEELRHPVGQHWTVAIVFAHLAFLDLRAQYVFDATEREGRVINPDWDIFVNDLALPFMAAMPVRQAADLAIEVADKLDERIETYPPDLLEQIHTERTRYVFRAFHRNEHLDEAEAALKVP
jgi:hypothetical protein